MRVADRVAEILVSNGIEDVFMVTGGAAMHLNDSFTRNKSLKVTFFHHEQACAMAAESYARIKGKPAVVSVTAGPGGLNTLNGIFGAWTDSIPVIVISGQVRTNTLNTNQHLRQLGDQEADIVNISKPITKTGILLRNPKEVDYHIQEAICIAQSERPGPVWIDIPIDIQGSIIKPKDNYVLKNTKDKKNIVDINKLKDLSNRLKKAKRPVIIAGNGIHISNQKKEFINFLMNTDIPVVTAFNGHDLLWENHKNYCGRSGTIGNRSGNIIVECADLILILGSRMNIRQIGYNFKDFGKESFVCMVDIDTNELTKPTLDINLKINSDLVEFFKFFKGKNLKNKTHKEFLKWSKDIKKLYGFEKENYKTTKYINPYKFSYEVSEHCKNSDIVVTSDATAALAPFQSFKIKKGQRLFTNSGSGSMGYGLPASIGASLASNHRVICFEGDGSLQMNIQELSTVSYNNLNIIIFVFCNEGYLSIKQTQNNYFKDNLSGFDSTNGIGFPDLKDIAKAYKLKYFKISKKKNLKSSLNQLFSKNGPILCEVEVDPNQGFQPRVTSRKDSDGNIVSSSLYDMFPFIDKFELEKILDIKNL